MTDTLESIRVFYLQQLCDQNLGENKFKTPWASLILKNCKENGELLDFKTIKDYKESRKQLWLLMSLKVFRYRDMAFPIFCCSECKDMKMVSNLGLYADPCDIAPFQCIHSKAAGFLLQNWNEIWEIELENDDTALDVFCNEEVKHFTFQRHSKTDTFLAGVQANGKVCLLQTVTKKQKFPFSPFCSSCSRQSCVHWLGYKQKQRENEDEFPFNQHLNQEQPGVFQGVVDHDHDQEEGNDQEEGSNEQNENAMNANMYNDEDSDEDDANPEEIRHWRSMPPVDMYKKQYGHNMTDILYPFKRDRDLQRGWMERMNGIYSFPNKFVPAWSESNLCKHGNVYDHDDQNLGSHCEQIVVYSNIGERVFDVEVLFRKTLAGCACIQQYDSHKHLLWHLGFGRFVDYTLLHQHVHRMRTSGMGIYAEYRAISESLEALGIESSLTYNDLYRAVSGFNRRLKFDEKVAFSCPTHGNTPRFLNVDGKNMGPTKRKVKHLEELERHEDDNEVLPQSTLFANRVFMPDMKERDLVVELLAGSKTMAAFCDSEITSANGQLVVNLVRALDNADNDKVPAAYKRFIGNICKPTSVRGLIQVTGPEALEYLKMHCEGAINIKTVEHQDKLLCVIQQLPVMWPILENICNFERSCIFPREVSDIVLKLLEIRENTFRNAADRNENAYHDYEAGEPLTMCFPNNPTIKHPKKYEVNNVKDKDLCEKAFLGHSHFTAGIFTAGCACKFNITLGWEIMLNNESPRNLFRLLTCNSFDLKKMVGVLIDHACKFDAYMLNREAKHLEYLLALVDGSHWNAQKKMIGPSSKSKGHLGCSEGFNWNLYKGSYSKDEAVNSQSREQMHAILDNLSKSMRLMNYEHFMLFLYVFFATTNLHNRSYK